MRRARQIAAAVIGGTILLLGVVLLFLPGPGLLGIGIGAAILASEFAWARRLVARVRERFDPSYVASPTNEDDADESKPGSAPQDDGTKRAR